MKAYTNARVFTGTSFLTNFTVLTENGLITSLVGPESIPQAAEIIDLKQHILAPAFVDLQIYGGNGSLFSHDLSAESLHATYAHCLEGGTAHFYITLATNSIDVFYRGIDAVRKYWKQGGKGMPGLHLEGPYLNPLKKGAHLEQYIKKPTIEEVRQLLEYGKDVIKIMTIAPEQCGDDVIELLLSSGILVSAGHSNASYDEGYAAFEKGIPAATHLFNAMSALQHRAPGLVGAIFNHPEVMSSIVPDGIHVDFAALRIAKKIMQHRLFAITDAVTAVSEGDYPHVFNEDRYVMPDGTLSGSALTLMKAVRNLVQSAGIEMGEALRMVSLYPAQLMKKEAQWGRIEIGHAADLTVFDDAFNVIQVITS